ncbi:MAG TPA: hypothetical protein VGE41_09540 [Verrucomicrobiae bacterium]
MNLRIYLLAIGLLLFGTFARAVDSVFFRVQLAEPADAPWYLKIGGYIHVDPWHMPDAVWPAKADKDQKQRIAPGQFSPWFDLSTHAGKKLHGRHHRAGGIAEFPNVTLDFFGAATNLPKHVVIELATAPEEGAIVKRMEEKFTGRNTSFLVSSNLRADAGSLETASQMTARHLAWAREASGGQRTSPTNLWIQTQFWAPQRPELNVQEAEVLWLLGFNLVGSTRPEMLDKFPFIEPGGHLWAEFGPALTREDIEKQMLKPASRAERQSGPTLFNFSDEIACRPPIGNNAKALGHFHEWLKGQKISPADLGVKSLDQVDPIESPTALREHQKTNAAAANRVFVWTTRFRHEAATQRLKWLTESFHAHAPSNIFTSTLVADHPYFGGSGLGMGMDRPNTTWGGYPLSLDWFGMAREHVVDVIAIEDWLGLNFMYGPSSTWEGFQLLGFQAAMFRSGSKGDLPIMTWITPSDETNVRLKSTSALCQGSKHFYYWTYGPTATSTENYWSDLRSEYDGVVKISRQLAGAEHIIAPGHTRKTRVALLYSLSSDLWQPFGYISMAERRLTYFSLIHDQYLVDMLTERDVEEGRLKEYSALYLTDPCIAKAASDSIRKWVRAGGWIYGSCAAGSRNEFNEEQVGLSDVFGLKKQIKVQVQPGRFDLRAALNDLAWLDQIAFSGKEEGFGALGIMAEVKPSSAKALAFYSDNSPAILTNHFGKGVAIYATTCPALSYAKDAHFVPAELKEKWPAAQRHFINSVAQNSSAPKLVELSHPVVEAGVYESSSGCALILANFTYEKIPHLSIRLPVKTAPAHVLSIEAGALPFSIENAPNNVSKLGYKSVLKCQLPLGLNDVLILE